ncbi:hypothetical protein G5V59_23175 [Nocardioides sp. W3-2-3]|uniref:hypothetical protein n=1 Tax=Nocardioides convexus TaxID=2712224 RepID=UPI0024182168|nr:hypothetical protein [Nocardioides convexus]NHA01661.1 hypothetical protein [Nocardioides convexus]
MTFTFTQAAPEGGTVVLKTGGEGKLVPAERYDDRRRHRGGRRPGLCPGAGRGVVPVGLDDRHREAVLRDGEAEADLLDQGGEVHRGAGLLRVQAAVRGLQGLRPGHRALHQQRRQLAWP